MLLSPAKYLIFKMGGVRETARVLGIDNGLISRWQKSGLIPSKHQKLVMFKARLKKLDITYRDMIEGRAVANSVIKKNKMEFLLE